MTVANRALTAVLTRISLIQIPQWLRTVLLAVIALAMGVGIGVGFTTNDWPLLVAVIGIGAHLIIALINPFHGLLLWMLTNPFERFIHLRIVMGTGVPNLGINRLVPAFLLLLLLAQLARGRRQIAPFGFVELFFVLFYLAIVASTQVAGLGTFSALQASFDGFFVPFLAYIFAKNLVRDERLLDRVIAVLILAATYISISTINEQLTGNIWFYPEGRSTVYSASVVKVVGLLGNAAFIAMVINMVAPFVLWRFLEHREPTMRVLYGVILVIMGVGVFMTYNRSGWLGFLLVLLAAGVLNPRSRKVLLPGLMVAGIVILVTWESVVNSPAVQERLTAERPLEYRYTANEIAFDMLRREPLLGVGYSNFGIRALQDYGWKPDRKLANLAAPHNSYLFVLVSGGLFAFIPYLLMFLALAWTGFRLWFRATRRERDILACAAGAWLAYIVPSVAFDNAHAYYTNTVFFLIMGAVTGALSWERWQVRGRLLGWPAPPDEEQR